MTEFGREQVSRSAQAETAALMALGVRAGDSVGWLAENGLRALALLEACLQLGARWVPLNWRLAAPELDALVRQADLQWLLHDEAMAPLAAALRPALPLPPAADHRAGDLMLVFSSGSSGGPKAAIHTVAGMAANTAAAIDAQDLGANTRTLAVLPLFHVGGLCIQVLPTLAAGGRVLLHRRFDPGAWLRDVAAWRPTTSLLVPAAMRAIVEHPEWLRSDLSSLAFVNSGSQVVPPSLIEAFHDRGVPVCQVYGSTETGPVSVVLRPAQAMAHVGSVGRPALGVRLRLADDGEICLQGPNLMRGYHRADAPAFDADGWFHTGDLGRWREGGLLEVVGRSSERIISGGENVHPAEIENLLVGHPDIAECAVVAAADPRWGEVPWLAVVARPGRQPDTGALAALFATRLARFKQPRAIIVVDALPKTALGKVQRSLLARELAARAG